MRDVTQEIVDENQNWLPVGSRVRVRETGAEGRVVAVMPDKFGAPWSIQVQLDESGVGDGCTSDTPLVLGPHEIERLGLN